MDARPDTAPALRSSLLDHPRIRHAFFTRAGGVSTGVYESLNGGVGSDDDPNAVAENRRRMARTIGVDAQRFLVPYQIHSADALEVAFPFAVDQRPRCDALVTRARSIGLGVTGADCGIILFADAEAGVVGAAHAGWKGALTGVLESTLQKMEELGASRPAIHAVLGPTISKASYEVGPEFVARFIESDGRHGRFFTPSTREGHSMFDLPGFIGMRLRAAGVGAFEDLAIDTYDEANNVFSYRRSVHRKEPDYGRHIAAIALA